MFSSFPLPMNSKSAAGPSLDATTTKRRSFVRFQVQLQVQWG